MATKSIPAPTKAAAPEARPMKTKTTADVQKPGKARAGPEDGVRPGKETVNKNATAIASKPAGTAMPKKLTPAPPTTTAKPRRKPRKLNKDSPSGATSDTASASAVTINTTDPASELDALKSRVRGLEAKVADLYKSSTSTTQPQPSRSPRRRGKGRKPSSSTQVPTLATQPEPSTTRIGDREPDAPEEEDQEEEEEADEQLERLQQQLDVARQDLTSYPYPPHRASDMHDIEDIPRNSAARPSRQLTLSGSYRIPLPTNVSVRDVASIKSGVTAAQNVARTFLGQRSAERRCTTTTTAAPQHAASGSRATGAGGEAAGRRDGGLGEAVGVRVAGDKQSWGGWIGGYSVAVTRAVRSMEHEAAVERQMGEVQAGSAADTRRKRSMGKKAPVKAELGSEQVDGLRR